MSDFTNYRLDQSEKRAEAADARMGRIESKIDDLRVTLAKMPTTVGLWGMIATVIGVALTMIGISVGILAYIK